MAKIKSTSRGLNTHSTLFLRPHDGEIDTFITTTGNDTTAQKLTNIFITPGACGFVDIDGTRFADNKIWAETIISTYDVSSELNGITGALFRINSASGLLGWQGIENDGVAGLLIDRGCEGDKYVVFDDSDERFKVGDLDDLKWLMATAEAPLEGSVLYVGASGWVDQDANFTWDESANILNITGGIELTGILGVSGGIDFTGNLDIEGDLSVVGQSQFDGDVDITGTVNITGDAYKNGYPLLNLQELDERYLEHIANETIDGDKVFNGEVTFEDDVDVNANISVSGSSQVDGVATFNGDVLANADIFVEGESHFKDDASFETDVNVDGDVCISGALKVQGEATFQNDVSIAQDLLVTGESHFVDEATFSADISAKANVHVDGYTTGTDSNLPNSYVTHAKLAAISASANDADEINYDNSNFPQYPNVADALNALLYVAPNVNSISVSINSYAGFKSGNILEIGSSVSDLDINWVLNKSLNGGSPTASLNQSIGSVPTTTPGTYNYTTSFTSNKTFTLSISELDPESALQADSSGSSVSFRWKRHWGTSSLTSLNNSQALALASSELSTSNNKTFTVSPSAEYIYFVSPQSFGTASFVVGGLSVTFNQTGIASFTNDSGGNTSYYVYRSLTVQNGTGIEVEVS